MIERWAVRADIPDRPHACILSRERLLSGTWGPETFASDRIVDNHIANLRRKIEPDPSNPRYLLNVRGLGYRFDATNLTEF